MSQLKTNELSDSEARQDIERADWEYSYERYKDFPVRSTSWRGLVLRAYHKSISIADRRMYPDDWNSEQKSIHFIIVLLLLQSMLMTWLVFVSLFIPISELLSPLQLFFSVPVCYMSVVILQVIFKYPRKSIEKYEKQKSESTDSTGDWV